MKAYWVVILLLSSPAFANPPIDLSLATGDRQTKIQVELAITDQQLSIGLMYRTELDANHGMLFLYPEKRSFSMWMANTYLPLDMLFFDNQGRLIAVADNVTPLSRRPIPAPAGTQAVLEVKAGLARQWRLAVGQTVIASPDLNQWLGSYQPD